MLILPSNLSLPFFAYGLFKSGQLGFFRIQDFVSDICEIEIQGQLRERDGIPLFDQTPNRYGNGVNGHLIVFQEGQEERAYKRIAEIEPKKIYSWAEIGVTSNVRANVLIGKKVKRGSDLLEYTSNWDGKQDPFFSEALEEIETILATSEHSFESYKPIFRLQMAYGLLWTALERYAGLRYHFGENAMLKVGNIANEEIFSTGLRKYVDKRNRTIYRTDDPGEKYILSVDNPKKALHYYYAVRSNAIHRGKAVHRDYETLYLSLKELLAIFKDLLNDAWLVHKEVRKCF